jgi:hypothetical protein
MSDDAEDQESTSTDELVKPTYEELEAIVAKTRQEAAGKRIRNKEMQAKLAEYEEWKLNQLSEVDRAKAEKAALAEELSQLRSERLRERVAAEAGLDSELAQFIVGNSEAEMKQAAKVLATKFGTGSQPARTAASLAGKRGKGVGTGAEVSEEDWFREQFEK